MNKKFPRTRRDDLIEHLMSLIFEKAREDSNEDKKDRLAKYLSERIEFKIDVRTLTRYYDGHILGNEKYRTIPHQFNLDILSNYLGFENFNVFKKKNEVKITKVKPIKERISIEIDSEEKIRIVLFAP